MRKRREKLVQWQKGERQCEEMVRERREDIGEMVEGEIGEQRKEKEERKGKEEEKGKRSKKHTVGREAWRGTKGRA